MIMIIILFNALDIFELIMVKCFFESNSSNMNQHLSSRLRREEKEEEENEI